MPSSNPFLGAILAQPDDDTPRLVYADWLEEHGDADRARFIRAQCELTRLPAWDRRHQELTWVANDLYARHGARWRAELPALDGIAWGEFERGFVSTIRVAHLADLYRNDVAISTVSPVYRAELSQFDESALPRPMNSLPWLRAVRLRYHAQVRLHRSRSLVEGASELEVVGVPEHGNLDWLFSAGNRAALTSLKVEGAHTAGRAFARGLASAAWARRLTHLSAGTRFVDHDTGYFDDPTVGAEGAESLARSAHLGELTTLNLNRQRIGEAGLDALLSSERLRELRELELRSNEIGQVSAFRSAEFRKLARLDLGDNPIGNEGAAALQASPGLATLQCLSLDTCEIGADGVTALTAAPFWDTLCRLDLSHNPLGAEGVRALAAAAPPARLHTLRLSDGDLHGLAVPALANCPWLTGLRSLDLSHNHLAEAAVAALSPLGGGPLRALSLAATRLKPHTVAQLSDLWPTLVSLDLSDNEVGGALAALARGGRACDLQVLRLSKAKLTSPSLESLVQPGTCPALHVLDLGGNDVPTSWLCQLVESPLPAQLEELDLSHCGLDDAAAQRIAHAPCLAGLRRLNLRGNDFGDESLCALARSRHLAGVPEVRLSGNPWRFPEASRRLLAARFGEGWYYQEDAEEQEEWEE